MLVLSRTEGESVMIGDDIEVFVVQAGGKVRLGFNAPLDRVIHRREVYDAIQRNGGVDRKLQENQQ